MQHYDFRNREQIRDAAPSSWATVHAADAATFSQLAHCGFHLIDMRGDLWTLLRAG